MSEELRKRIGDAYLNPTFVDGQVLLHTQLNEIVSVTKAGINENYYDIQRLIKGEYSVGNSEKLNGALLSRYLDTTLQEDDNLVPSSQQVKAYVDKAIEDVQLGSETGNIMLEVNALKTKVSANEGSIGDLQTGVSTNATDIDNLEIEVDTLQDEVNDLKENPVGDTLPYGTIVDYDGTEIPTGYEQVDDDVVTLYFDEIGSNGNIPLNDYVYNYNSVGILFVDDQNIYNSARFEVLNGAWYSLQSFQYDPSSNQIVIRGKNVQLVDNAILEGSAAAVAWKPDSPNSVFWNDNIRIIKVVGYRGC